MNRPTWVTVVGVIGIIFASFSILGGIVTSLSPSLFKVLRNTLDEIQRRAEEQQTETVQNENGLTDTDSASRQRTTAENKEKLEKLKEQLELTSAERNRVVIVGLLTVALAVFFLFASIMLLKLKSYAPTLFVVAAILRIMLKIVQAIIQISAGASVNVGFISSIFFGVAIDVALLIIVLVSDKTAFHTPKAAIVRNVEKD